MRIPFPSSRFQRFIDVGIPARMGAFEAKHIRLCNAVAIIAFVGASVFFLLELPLITDWGKTTGQELRIILLRGLSCLPLLLPILLNARNRHHAARMMVVCWSCVLVLELGWMFGRFAPSHVFLIVLAFLLPSIFPPREGKSLYFAATVTAVTFGALLFLCVRDRPNVPVERPEIRIVMYVVVAFGAFILAHFFGKVVRDTTRSAEAMARFEKDRADRLLLNILPRSIANRLMEAPGTIADGFTNATVLFADLVGFTPLSESLSPKEIVHLMDDIFTRFDTLVEAHGLEKIKTIGDAYMLAGGLPDPQPEHCRDVAEMALDMQETIAGMESPNGLRLQLRIGIASGPVVAGVIGRKKFLYDLWGDTVNTASRLESHGVPGRIQVCERTRSQLPKGFLWEERGPIDIKGIGELSTWFLLEREASGGVAHPRESGGIAKT